MNSTSLSTARQQKDAFFKNSPDSPLSDDLRAAFAGLHYFPENSDMRFEVTVELFDPQADVQMQTSTGEVRDYVRYGRFHFTVDGQPAALTVYEDTHGGFFVPFTDATSGTETYGAGRYLELEELPGGRFVADFNTAYNPWCAYSPYYSCPFPLAENRLRVPIRAGEMDFPEGHA